MEPFRVITSPEELAELRVNTIVCPPSMPSFAYRKTWQDRFVTFESPSEWDNRQTWDILTMHCPEGASEVWVLWDPEARKVTPKHSAFVTVVPSRSPRRKAHMGIGNAKSAITTRLYSGVAKEDMSILQLDPVSGEYTLLHDIPKGTLKSQLPW